MNIFTTIFVQPLLNILLVLYAFLPGHDFGVAVIGLTIIVRLLLWPLVNKQLHSQRKIQQLQPEVVKIRKAAKGDRQRETQELMELYKAHGTSPFASILPILLQLPILFALVSVFNHSLHVDQVSQLAYGFVKQIPYVAGLLDHSIAFNPSLFGWINMTQPNWILAVTAGVAQFFQARMLQPKPGPDADTQTKMMSNMTYIFPVVTIVFALQFASALALYWTVSSLMAILQQYIVLHKDADEMEEVAEHTEEAQAIAASVAGAEQSPKQKARKTRKAKTKAKKRAK